MNRAVKKDGANQDLQSYKIRLVLIASKCKKCILLHKRNYFVYLLYEFRRKNRSINAFCACRGNVISNSNKTP